MPSTSSSSSNANKESIYNTMIASSLSGMLSRIPLHPIDTIKAKLQVANCALL